MAITVRKGPLLREMTTLGLGGKALAEVLVDRPEDLHGLADKLKELGGRPMALGRGSNILAEDKDLDLVLVRMASGGAQSTGRSEPDFKVLGHNLGKTTVRVGAGERLPWLLGRLADRGLAGMEGLCGIPGTVGGAVAMNAGSYGCETAQVLERVQIWTPERGLFWVEKSGFETGYRHFSVNRVQGFFLVTACELALEEDALGSVRGKMRSNRARKKATQPISARSAGCVFKNPRDKDLESVSAGLLLDRAGLRGFSLGNMGFADMHANFMINLGKGTSSEAFALIELARERVKEFSGHDLELEVKVLQ